MVAIYWRFDGFVSNRFGRIAQYLDQQENISQFFDETVDKNANKLVLAVQTYMQNHWFELCSELYSDFGDFLIFLVMNLLRIDDRSTLETRIVRGQTCEIF
jgi:hypothetical protein